MAYQQPAEGEWVQPVRRGYKMACCDCGLVHVLDFRVQRNRVQFRVFRHARATGQLRRQMLRRGELRIREASDGR
jgi:hypothetical protein